jgi:hypothetical protein
MEVKGKGSVAPSPIEPNVSSELALFRGAPTRELERLAPLLHRRTFPFLFSLASKIATISTRFTVKYVTPEHTGVGWLAATQVEHRRIRQHL